MKLSKGQGISLFSAFVLFGIFNTVVFLAPLAHTVVFWLGYFFALFALITFFLTLTLYFGKPVKEEKFLGLPAVKSAWTYFGLQTALSLWEMIAFPLPYLPALVINLVLGTLFVIVILALYAAAGKIDKSDAYIAEKVIFIKQLKLQLDSMETEDEALAQKIKELAEDVRFSDQMSHSMLADIENELSETEATLADSLENAETATALCEKATKLLKKRNQQCKMYKGVKDPAAAQAKKSDGGLGLAFAGVGAMLAMFLIALAVCFVIVPQTKYNDAVALMDAQQYAEATVAFAELGDYKDSAAKIKEIETILLDEAYDAAARLLENKQYDEAILAFTALGDHRDSKEKVTEIENTVRSNLYAEAEALFNAGKYEEALPIYITLGDYEDSKLRIEQINNRQADGDSIYFGTYNGEPICWTILKTEEEKMLLITEKPIAQKPFTDEIKKITWEISALRAWLNGEFMESFSAEQQAQMLATAVDGVTDKVFLLSVKEMNDLVDNQKITFKTSDEFWTRTATDDGIMYAAATGWVKATGDHVIRDKGVRPAIWISLN